MLTFYKKETTRSIVSCKFYLPFSTKIRKLMGQFPFLFQCYACFLRRISLNKKEINYTIVMKEKEMCVHFNMQTYCSTFSSPVLTSHLLPDDEGSSLIKKNDLHSFIWIHFCSERLMNCDPPSNFGIAFFTLRKKILFFWLGSRFQWRKNKRRKSRCHYSWKGKIK